MYIRCAAQNTEQRGRPMEERHVGDVGSLFGGLVLCVFGAGERRTSARGSMRYVAWPVPLRWRAPRWGSSVHAKLALEGEQLYVSRAGGATRVDGTQCERGACSVGRAVGPAAESHPSCGVRKFQGDDSCGPPLPPTTSS